MSLLLTSFLISLIAALWVWIGGRKDPQGRPWLTVVSLSMLLVLPLLTLLPKFQWDVLGVIDRAGQVDVTQGSIWQNVWFWALVVWFSGSVLMVVRMVYGQRVLTRWIADSEELCGDEWQQRLDECAAMLGMEKLPVIRVKQDLASPVVAGLLKPVVLIPSTAVDWPAETLKMAVLHELSHIQRKDLWVRLAADAACALHWYNPLVWWMRSKLFTQCEYACDARVIASGANPKTYISALCDVVERAIRETSTVNQPSGVCAMADHAPLKMRVKRLLHVQRASSPWLSILAAILTTATALGLTLVRPAMKQVGEVPVPGNSEEGYAQNEIDLRHSANPFPGNE